MAQQIINYDRYKIKAFLDTNIILEGKQLSDLPWEEIDTDGPIIALISPTVMREIDSKKQDGRLGERARQFNRLISPVAAGGAPIVIRDDSPRVELALCRAKRIDWDHFDDLDSRDGDSCVIAEALHAKDMNDEGKVMVSHDIKPIALAINHDIQAHHVSDDWLRPKESHPKDREIQKLKQQITQYQSLEPKFEITLEIGTTEPLEVFQIQDLIDSERQSIESRLRSLNPRITQTYSALGLDHMSHDSSYDDRYDAYLKQITKFIKDYSKKIERSYNQVPFKLRVKNTSEVHASNLLVECLMEQGWVHDRFILMPLAGPKKPKPKGLLSYAPRLNLGNVIATNVDRHECQFKVKPDYEPVFSVICEDFRHNQEYIFEGSLIIDARSIQTSQLSVSVTSSNYRGTAKMVKPIATQPKQIHISELVDLETFKFIKPPRIMELFNKESLDLFDFRDYEWET